MLCGAPCPAQRPGRKTAAARGPEKVPGSHFRSPFRAPSALLGRAAAAMTDRYTIHSQLEHLQSKYIGTGHADTTKWEWLVNQHRDSYCSYMGHFDLLNYFAIAENESKARVRFNLMEKMLQPCGPPADKPDES
ncbi:splicing factor 3B subunit 5 [Amazona ochrocephala]